MVNHDHLTWFCTPKLWILELSQKAITKWLFINKQPLNHHWWITLTPKKCCFHIVVYWWTILKWLQSCCCSLMNNLTLMNFLLLINYSWMNDSKLGKLFIGPNSPLPTPYDVFMLWALNTQTCFHTLGIKQIVL